jgi:hypothetical protein
MASPTPVRSKSYEYDTEEAESKVYIPNIPNLRELCPYLHWWQGKAPRKKRRRRAPV